MSKLVTIVAIGTSALEFCSQSAGIACLMFDSFDPQCGTFNVQFILM